MCGIAGIFGSSEKEVEHRVRAMCEKQAHRGPDDEGLEVLNLPGGFLAFGHQRLSILDLSYAGHQPMENPETGDCLVFNGEIYNFVALKKELEGSGAIFRSRCDTEVILHAFARWGTACFDRFRGMFALAIYEKSEQRVIIARDPLGIKPLYYSVLKEGFVFSSEIRAMSASGLISTQINRRALAGLLAYGAVPEPLTMYQDVHLLEAGTYAVLDVSDHDQSITEIQSSRYWDFPYLQEIPKRSHAIEKVRDLLETAVCSHLMSDVPVGVFLSSGLDSTAIATLSAKVAQGQINTFTITLTGNQEMDEGPEAEQTARLLGTKHHCVKLTETDVRKQLPQYLASMDQPTVDGLNTYIISGAVRARGIKVALSGLGGDEFFGGYQTFRDVPFLARWAPFAGWIPPKIRSRSAELLFAKHSKSQRLKAKELSVTKPTLRNLYFRRRRLFSDDEMAAFGFDKDDLDLNEDFLPDESLPDRYLDRQGDIGGVGILETRFYMGNMLLRDSDVFGMAHGLEIRVPLLDRDLTDYLSSLPGKWRVGNKGVNKPLLVDAMGSNLRRELSGMPKRGFVLPQSHWMAGPLNDHFVHLFDALRGSGVVEPKAANEVWRGFIDDQQGPNWSRAWMLGVLGAWMEKNELH